MGAVERRERGRGPGRARDDRSTRCSPFTPRIGGSEVSVNAFRALVAVSRASLCISFQLVYKGRWTSKVRAARPAASVLHFGTCASCQLLCPAHTQPPTRRCESVHGPERCPLNWPRSASCPCSKHHEERHPSHCGAHYRGSAFGAISYCEDAWGEVDSCDKRTFGMFCFASRSGAG